MDKVHVSQQPLCATGVITCTYMSFKLPVARLEVIHVFHKNRNLGFHFGGQLFTNVYDPDPGIRVAFLGINRNRVLCLCLQGNSIDMGYQTSWAIY